MDCCDYIGATGINPTIDYIDTTSNILESHIYQTSNILHTYTDTSITILDNKYNKLIKEKTEQEIINGISLNLTNTYITNSNLGGQIKFYMNNIIDCNVPVFIDREGYLQVYYKYNGLINLLENSGYKNIVNEISSSKASINLQGGFIGTLQLETAGIIAYLIKNRPQNEIGELLEAPAFSLTSTYTAITSALNNISVRLQNILFNNNFTLFLGTPVAVGLFAAAQAIAHNDAAQVIGQAIIKQYNSNLQLTTTQKQDLLNYGSNLYAENINKAIDYTCNLNVISGFINSNIATAQTIPLISTTNITINYNSTGGHIKLYTTNSNANTAIVFNNNAGIQSYIGIGGTNILNYANNFIINSASGIIFSTASQNNLMAPSMCIANTGATALNAFPSTIPTGYRFYVNGTSYFNGSITATNIIYGGSELSNQYLKLTGGTLTGGLIGTTINLSGNLTTNSIIYNGSELSNQFLKLGGGTLTGALSATSINCTSLITNSIIYNGSELSNQYLKLTGGTLTGALTTTDLNVNGISKLANYSVIGYPYVDYNGYSQTSIFAGPSTAVNLILESHASTYGACLLLTNNSGTNSFITVGGSTTTPTLFRNNMILSATNSIILNGGNHATETPDFIINSSGNVGIGTNASTSFKLLTNGEIKSTGLTVDNANGAYLTLTASNPAIDTGIYLYNTSAPGVAGYIGIGGTTLANLVSQSNLTITSKNSIVFNNFSSPTASMIIDNNGNTTINGTLNIKSITINNWLFNNTGGTHADLNNFNLVTTAGYKFIGGNTNSPSTGYTQYYSWLIGIGSNYPVTGTGSYSCQFALPRLPTNNPRLFIRYNENNSWGGWNGIIASSADVLTSGNKTISGDLSITGTLNFGSRVQDNLLYLYGTNYGFGINADTLRYNCPSTASHKFYNGSTNTATIDNSGNLSTSGYVFAGGTTSGLRINGNDYGNTIYQGATTIGGQPASIGFTLRDNNLFNFWSLSTTGGGYTNIANMNTSAINLNKNVTITGNLNVNGTITGQYNIICSLTTIAGIPNSWRINLNQYNIAGQANSVYFSCSHYNSTGPITIYWVGHILINSFNASSPTINFSTIFNSTNCYPSWFYDGTLWLEIISSFSVTGSILKYKVIG